MSALIPLEHLDSNYSLVYNLLTELIQIKSRETQEKCLSIYNRLVASNLLSTLPGEKLESWLSNWFTLFRNLELSEQSKQQFEKILKKCLHHLMKEKNIDIYSNFIFNLADKLNLNQNDNLDYLIKLTFLHSFEKTIKIQEFSTTSDTNLNNKIKKLDQKLFDIIIKKKLIDNAESFFICSILINSLLSSNFKDDVNKDKKLEHFEIFLNNCLEQHKKYSKQIRDQNSNLRIDSHYFDFFNNLIVNSEKLTKFYQIKIDKFKLVKQLFKIFQKFNFSLDMNENYFGKNLMTSLVQSMNAFNADEFKKMLSYIDNAIEKCCIEQTTTDLIKISKLIKFMANDVELSDDLKQDFAEFLQKVFLKYL